MTSERAVEPRQYSAAAIEAVFGGANDDLTVGELRERLAATPPRQEPCDPWVSAGDDLTPNQRLALAHSSGIEVGKSEARQEPAIDVERLGKALRAADVPMGQRHDETFPLDLYDQAWTRYAEFIAAEYDRLGSE